MDKLKFSELIRYFSLSNYQDRLERKFSVEVKEENELKKNSRFTDEFNFNDDFYLYNIGILRLYEKSITFNENSKVFNPVTKQSGDILERELDIFEHKFKFSTLKQVDQFLESVFIHKLVSGPNFFKDFLFKICKDTISLNSLLLFLLLSFNFRENIDNTISPKNVDSIFTSSEKFINVNNLQNIMIHQSLGSITTNICSDKKFIYYFSDKFSFLHKAILINDHIIHLKERSIGTNFTGTIMCYKDILFVCSILKGKFNLILIENFDKFIVVNPQLTPEMNKIFNEVKDYLFTSSDNYIYLLDCDTNNIYTFELDINEKIYLKYQGMFKLNLRDNNSYQLKKFNYFYVIKHIIFLFSWDESNLFLSVFNRYLHLCINYLSFQQRNVNNVFFFEGGFFVKSVNECKRILIDLAQYGDYDTSGGLVSQNGLNLNEPTYTLTLFIFLQDLKNEPINIHLLYKLISITLSKIYVCSNIDFHKLFYFSLVIYRKNVVQLRFEDEENFKYNLEDHFEFFFDSLINIEGQKELIQNKEAIVNELIKIISKLCVFPKSRFRDFLDLLSKDNFENSLINHLHVCKDILLAQINTDINYVKGFLLSLYLRVFEEEKRIINSCLTCVDNLINFQFMFDTFKIVSLNNSIIEDILEIFNLLLPELLTLLNQKCEIMDIAYNDAFHYLGEISIVFYSFYLMIVNESWELNESFVKIERYLVFQKVFDSLNNIIGEVNSLRECSETEYDFDFVFSNKSHLFTKAEKKFLFTIPGKYERLYIKFLSLSQKDFITIIDQKENEEKTYEIKGDERYTVIDNTENLSVFIEKYTDSPMKFKLRISNYTFYIEKIDYFFDSYYLYLYLFFSKLTNVNREKITKFPFHDMIQNSLLFKGGMKNSSDINESLGKCEGLKSVFNSLILANSNEILDSIQINLDYDVKYKLCDLINSRFFNVIEAKFDLNNLLEKKGFFYITVIRIVFLIVLANQNYLTDLIYLNNINETKKIIQLLENSDNLNDIYLITVNYFKENSRKLTEKFEEKKNVNEFHVKTNFIFEEINTGNRLRTNTSISELIEEIFEISTSNFINISDLKEYFHQINNLSYFRLISIVLLNNSLLRSTKYNGDLCVNIIQIFRQALLNTSRKSPANIMIDIMCNTNFIRYKILWNFKILFFHFIHDKIKFSTNYYLFSNYLECLNFDIVELELYTEVKIFEGFKNEKNFFIRSSMHSLFFSDISDEIFAEFHNNSLKHSYYQLLLSEKMSKAIIFIVKQINQKINYSSDRLIVGDMFDSFFHILNNNFKLTCRNKEKETINLYYFFKKTSRLFKNKNLVNEENNPFYFSILLHMLCYSSSTNTINYICEQLYFFLKGMSKAEDVETLYSQFSYSYCDLNLFQELLSYFFNYKEKLIIFIYCIGSDKDINRIKNKYYLNIQEIIFGFIRRLRQVGSFWKGSIDNVINKLLTISSANNNLFPCLSLLGGRLYFRDSLYRSLYIKKKGDSIYNQKDNRVNLKSINQGYLKLIGNQFICVSTEGNRRDKLIEEFDNFYMKEEKFDFNEESLYSSLLNLVKKKLLERMSRSYNIQGYLEKIYILRIISSNFSEFKNFLIEIFIVKFSENNYLKEFFSLISINEEPMIIYDKLGSINAFYIEDIIHKNLINYNLTEPLENMNKDNRLTARLDIESDKLIFSMEIEEYQSLLILKIEEIIHYLDVYDDERFPPIDFKQILQFNDINSFQNFLIDNHNTIIENSLIFLNNGIFDNIFFEKDVLMNLFEILFYISGKNVFILSRKNNYKGYKYLNNLEKKSIYFNRLIIENQYFNNNLISIQEIMKFYCNKPVNKHDLMKKDSFFIPVFDLKEAVCIEKEINSDDEQIKNKKTIKELDIFIYKDFLENYYKLNFSMLIVSIFSSCEGDITPFIFDIFVDNYREIYLIITYSFPAICYEYKFFGIDAKYVSFKRIIEFFVKINPNYLLDRLKTSFIFLCSDNYYSDIIKSNSILLEQYDLILSNLIEKAIKEGDIEKILPVFEILINSSILYREFKKSDHIIIDFCLEKIKFIYEQKSLNMTKKSETLKKISSFNSILKACDLLEFVLANQIEMTNYYLNILKLILFLSKNSDLLIHILINNYKNLLQVLKSFEIGDNIQKVQDLKHYNLIEVQITLPSADLIGFKLRKSVEFDNEIKMIYLSQILIQNNKIQIIEGKQNERLIEECYKDYEVSFDSEIRIRNNLFLKQKIVLIENDNFKVLNSFNEKIKIVQIKQHLCLFLTFSNKVLLYGQRGTTKYNELTELTDLKEISNNEHIQDVNLFGDDIFILTERNIYCISKDIEHIYFKQYFKSKYKKLFLLNNNENSTDKDKLSILILSDNGKIHYCKKYSYLSTTNEISLVLVNGQQNYNVEEIMIEKNTILLVINESDTKNLYFSFKDDLKEKNLKLTIISSNISQLKSSNKEFYFINKDINTQKNVLNKGYWMNPNSIVCCKKYSDSFEYFVFRNNYIIKKNDIYWSEHKDNSNVLSYIFNNNLIIKSAVCNSLRDILILNENEQSLTIKSEEKKKMFSLKVLVSKLSNKIGLFSNKGNWNIYNIDVFLKVENEYTCLVELNISGSNEEIKEYEFSNEVFYQILEENIIEGYENYREIVNFILLKTSQYFNFLSSVVFSLEMAKPLSKENTFFMDLINSDSHIHTFSLLFKINPLVSIIKKNNYYNNPNSNFYYMMSEYNDALYRYELKNGIRLPNVIDKTKFFDFIKNGFTYESNLIKVLVSEKSFKTFQALIEETDVLLRLFNQYKNNSFTSDHKCNDFLCSLIKRNLLFINKSIRINYILGKMKEINFHPISETMIISIKKLNNISNEKKVLIENSLIFMLYQIYECINNQTIDFFSIKDFSLLYEKLIFELKFLREIFNNNTNSAKEFDAFSSSCEATKKMYFMLGYLVGNAIHNQYFSDITFISDLLFKVILEVDISIKDLVDLDKDLYKSLNKISEQNFKQENVKELINLLEEKNIISKNMKSSMFNNTKLSSQSEAMCFISQVMKLINEQIKETLKFFSEGLKIFLPEDFQFFLTYTELKCLISGEYYMTYHDLSEKIKIENDLEDICKKIIINFYINLSYHNKSFFLSKLFRNMKYTDLAVIKFSFSQEKEKSSLEERKIPKDSKELILFLEKEFGSSSSSSSSSSLN